MNAELARQVQDYAAARYEAGWDYIVECYEISDLVDLFAREGIKNLDAAIEHFAPIVAVRNERLADARYEAEAGM